MLEASVFARLMPSAIKLQAKQKPPGCPFYKASGGFLPAGVEGIEPSSGVLETPGRFPENLIFKGVASGYIYSVPTFVPTLL